MTVTTAAFTQPFSLARSGVSWAGVSNPNINSGLSAGGILTQTGIAAAHVLNFNNDAVDASSAGGSYNVYAGHVLNSPLKRGHATALTGVVVVSHATGNTDPGKFYTGSASSAIATANDNGVAGAGNARGNLFGGFDSASLLAGATFWNSVCGREIDVEARAGSVPNFKVGLQIVQRSTDVEQGATVDAAFIIAGQGGTSPGWLNGIQFGSASAFWNMAATATLIGTQATALGGAVYAASFGVDFLAVAFGTAAFRSTGFLVDPTGITTVKALVAQPGASQTPTANGDVTFQLTNNTTLTFKAKGSDGTVRSGAMTLN